MIVIDATDLIVGRFATIAAKKALLGETITIVNCQDAVISGDKKKLFERYLYVVKTRGTHAKGPFYHRQPDRLVRRIIRGMLPHRQAKGKEAFKRIMCYIGVPPEFAQQERLSIEAAHIRKLPTLKYSYMKDLCKFLGGKQ